MEVERLDNETGHQLSGKMVHLCLGMRPGPSDLFKWLKWSMDNHTFGIDIHYLVSGTKAPQITQITSV